MPQPKPSSAKVSMPTFSTLEAWTRSQVQELMQSVLEEEVTHALGRVRYQRQGLLDAPNGYRKGHGKPRKLSFTSGTIEVKRPRVRGLEERFESAILPLFARRTQEVGQAAGRGSAAVAVFDRAFAGRVGGRNRAPRGAREPGGMQGPTNGLSQQPVEAGGSLTLGAQGKVEAASTTTEWSGTSRHSTSGKQDGMV